MNIKHLYLLLVAIICQAYFTACNFESNATKSKNLCTKGLAEYDAKDYKQSLADYTKAIALDSTNGTAFEGKGSAEYYLGKYDTAIWDEFTAKRLDPELKNVNSWIGQIKIKQGDYNGAIEYYNKSIESGNPEGLDYEGRGAAEYHLADYDKAMQDETKAIQMDTKLENAYYWRGLIKNAMGDYKGSIEDHLK